MGLFFHAATKIQKDRAVLRKIDLELANRSLPGVFSYFIVYLIIDFLLGYPEEHRLLSFSFGLLALIIAAARIYFAVAFEKQYSRGPAKWRGWFLWLSIFNGFIWSVLLCFVLLHQEFTQAHTIALVYTAALTSGITMVYAQYIRFVKIYLLVVLIPAAFILLSHWSILNLVTGIGVIGYLVFLYTESLKYHESFWQRVDSQAQLEQKIAQLNATQIEREQSAHINENVLSIVMQMIKTPLQGVLGMLSLLVESKLSNEQRHSIDVAQQSGDDLVNLITDLEDFTQLRNGQIQIENKFFDLRKYTEHLLESLGPTSHQQGTELSFLYNINVPSRLSLDKKQIGQVIQSLIIFGINHCKGDEVVFKIAAEEHGKKPKLRICTYFENADLDIERLKNLVKNMQIDQDIELSSSVLSLMIASRLIELMNGKIQFQQMDSDVVRIQIRIPLEASSQQIDAFQPDKSLQGRAIILIGMAERSGKGLAVEAESWGMQAQNIQVEDLVIDSEPKSNLLADYYLVNLPLKASLQELEALVNDIKSVADTSGQIILYGSMEHQRHLIEMFDDLVYLPKPAGRYSFHASLLTPELNQTRDGNFEQPIVDPSKRIIIAEDDPVNKLVTEALVKKLGYQYESVENGEELLQRLTESHFDLILMDCQMPVIDGYDATTAIRNLEIDTDSHIPIIAITAKATIDEERHCLTVGMDDCLAKPVTLGSLGLTIQRWLD